MQTLQRPVKIECGVPKVSQKIAEFMASCKAKISTRYVLDAVGVINDQMAVTDGRRLLVVTPIDTFDPPIAEGIYHLTGEGFLLKIGDDRKFPKWQDIIPKDAKKLGNFILDDGHGIGVAKAMAAIFETKAILNIPRLLGAFNGLKNCRCSSITISKQDGNYPIMITADSIGVNFQYVQMPFSGEIEK